MRHIVRFLLFIGLVLTSLSVFAQREITKACCVSDPHTLAINPVTNIIYVVDKADPALYSINPTTNQFGDSASVGALPGAPVINSVTNKIYVPSALQHSVTVVDGANMMDTRMVLVGAGPVAAAVNSVTNKIYVADADDNTVTIIDGATLATTTVPVDSIPSAVAVDSVTNKIYVGCQHVSGPSSVVVIDGTNNHTTSIPLSSSAYFLNSSDSLMVDAVTHHIYVIAQVYLYDIDGSNNQAFPLLLPASSCAQSIGLNSVTNHLYAPDSCTSNILDINLANHGISSIYTGERDSFLSVDTVRNRLYAADPYGYTLSVVDRNLNSIINFNLPVTSQNIVTNASTNTTYFGSIGSVPAFVGATPMQFVGTQPCRLFDTRQHGGPIQGGAARKFAVLSAGCGIPATAAAYSLNVTLVPSDGPVGYLTIWPTDQLQPTVSTMNSRDGRNKAAAAIVSAGTAGAVSVYVSQTTNVVLDIDGYFAPSDSSTLAFYPITPCRVIDTRSGTGHLNGPYLAAGVERDFPLLESSCMPAGVDIKAYSLNFTAAPNPASHPLGYLTVWPQGQPQPVVSTLNNPTGTVVANAAIVPAGSGGGIAVYPNQTTDLVVDINGYFAMPGANGLSLYSTAPCRVLDTRGGGSGQPFSGDLPVNVAGSPCEPPAAAQAYVFNATVVPPGSLGYLTLWADGYDMPVVSTLNAQDGTVTSNMAVVPTANGAIDAYASSLTHLLLDISAYFAP